MTTTMDLSVLNAARRLNITKTKLSDNLGYSSQVDELLQAGNKIDLAMAIEQLTRQLAVAEEGLSDLYSYCASSKFQGLEPADRMINKDDIFLRIDETRRNITLAEFSEPDFTCSTCEAKVTYNAGSEQCISCRNDDSEVNY